MSCELSTLFVFDLRDAIKNPDNFDERYINYLTSILVAARSFAKRGEVEDMETLLDIAMYAELYYNELLEKMNGVFNNKKFNECELSPRAYSGIFDDMPTSISEIRAIGYRNGILGTLAKAYVSYMSGSGTGFEREMDKAWSYAEESGMLYDECRAMEGKGYKSIVKQFFDSALLNYRAGRNDLFMSSMKKALKYRQNRRDASLKDHRFDPFNTYS